MKSRSSETADFSVQVSSLGGARYRATVVGSPAGEGSAVLELPVLPEDISVSSGLLVRAAARYLRPAGSGLLNGVPTPPEELGAALYSSLFTGEVRTLFERSWPGSREAPGGL